MDFIGLKQQAKQLDADDALAGYRDQFHFPTAHGKGSCLYLVGNSLGLQPKRCQTMIQEALDSWAMRGVTGHCSGNHPWLPYHECVTESLATLVGAEPAEVVAMNSLTTNLHLLMVSFFRPQGQRRKILIEANAFPSDRYAVLSQLRFHGLTEADLVVMGDEAAIKPLTTETIMASIEQHADEAALLLLGGVQYLTGQVFDIAGITAFAQAKGITVGVDLAHAAGNIPLALHDWDVDFAAWCSYKYLNAGPGGIAGAFVHQRHLSNSDMPRFEGWWGNNKQRRFLMENTFEPIPTAEAWQLSNPPIFQLAALRASLDLFDEVGTVALQEKAQRLNLFSRELLTTLNTDAFEIITPQQNSGCQLSLKLTDASHALLSEEKLFERGAYCDYREPGILRVAPVPFYNSFMDMCHFVELLETLLR